MSVVYLGWPTLLAWSTNIITTLWFIQFIAWALTCPQWQEVPPISQNRPQLPSLGRKTRNLMQRRPILLQETRKRDKMEKHDQYTNAVTWVSATWSYQWSWTFWWRKFVQVCYDACIDSAHSFPSHQQHSADSLLLDHTHMLSPFSLSLSTVHPAPAPKVLE